MSIDQNTLATKLREMYPEIDKHGMALSLNFDEVKKAWIVKLNKGQHELKTHLEKKDADECLEGIECVYLGVQIGQFVKNFEVS